jgi:hypothetical protein
LLAHIAAHQYSLEQGSGNPVPWEEATVSWYDTVYLPLVQLIEAKNLLKDFPHRTPADLYAWVMEHELELRQACDTSQVDGGVALDDFATLYSGRPLVAQIKAIRRRLDRLLKHRQPPCESQ